MVSVCITSFFDKNGDLTVLIVPVVHVVHLLAGCIMVVNSCTCNPMPASWWVKLTFQLQ